MLIYNTLSRKKEEPSFKTPGKATVYVCGPTVYNYIHIGNARPMCVFDVLRRYLEYSGLSVLYVRNFTDVDDKIIRQAAEEGVSPAELSRKYIREYVTDEKGLNVKPPDIQPTVTDNIAAVIGFIQTLTDKGFAYPSGGDVFFRTGRFKSYGELSGMRPDDLRAGARIDVNSAKEDAADFALWKAAKEGEPYWDSPWGAGRPGWHIECSALIKTHIGDTVDIHCGGQDLIFPHHENEIAQSESATGQPLAGCWMHNGYININNKKMSKSEGNVFTVRDLSERFGYEPIRFFMLSAHYRSPVNYGDEAMTYAKASLERLYNCRGNAERALKTAPDGDPSPEFAKRLEQRKAAFIAALDDDLNTADAIAVLFELTKDLNTLLQSGYAKPDLSAGLTLFNEFAGLLGILYAGGDDDVSEEALKLAQARDEARREKNYALADSLREQLSALGYITEETRQGTVIKRRS